MHSFMFYCHVANVKLTLLLQYNTIDIMLSFHSVYCRVHRGWEATREWLGAKEKRWVTYHLLLLLKWKIGRMRHWKAHSAKHTALHSMTLQKKKPIYIYILMRLFFFFNKNKTMLKTITDVKNLNKCKIK